MRRVFVKYASIQNYISDIEYKTYQKDWFGILLNESHEYSFLAQQVIPFVVTIIVQEGP